MIDLALCFVDFYQETCHEHRFFLFGKTIAGWTALTHTGLIRQCTYLRKHVDKIDLSSFSVVLISSKDCPCCQITGPVVPSQ